MNHVMQLTFSNFINTMVITQPDLDGNPVKGIFIPFEENCIKYTKFSKVYANFYILQKKNNMYFNQTHSVKPCWDKSHHKRMSELGYDKPPFVGNVKPCWDKNINKAYSGGEAKGFVKLNNTEEEDEE